MSFLDNLENNLKSLESRQEESQDGPRREQSRARERAAAVASASFAEELKKGPYTAELLRQCARVGHGLRTKIHIAWLGSNLRLEARDRRLELRPTAAGIVAVELENAREIHSQPVDLKTSPEALLRQWLNGLAAPAAEPPPLE
jgi:hypothetical protein